MCFYDFSSLKSNSHTLETIKNAYKYILDCAVILILRKLFPGYDTLHFIQLVQRFYWSQIIYIQIFYFVTNLLQHRIVQLKETKLKTFPLFSNLTNRLRNTRLAIID